MVNFTILSSEGSLRNPSLHTAQRQLRTVQSWMVPYASGTWETSHVMNAILALLFKMGELHIPRNLLATENEGQVIKRYMNNKVDSTLPKFIAQIWPETGHKDFVEWVEKVQDGTHGVLNNYTNIIASLTLLWSPVHRNLSAASKAFYEALGNSSTIIGRDTTSYDRCSSSSRIVDNIKLPPLLGQYS